MATRLGQLTADSTTAALEALDREVDDVVDRYEAQGPFRLVSDARSIQKSIVTMMAGAHPPRVLAQLYVRAARVSGVLAYMAINARRPTLAARYSEEA